MTLIDSRELLASVLLKLQCVNSENMVLIISSILNQNCLIFELQDILKYAHGDDIEAL